MSEQLRFDGRVAIVTGAGNGLGRSHALLLGARGAKVVVNDLGGGIHGGGKSSAAADKVVEEIKALGGEAVANYDSVEDGAKIVQTALDAFGTVDIVINNAGILRDVSFQKMTAEDWNLILKVHLTGSFSVSHAAWPILRDKGYGRIIMTTSAAGLYGNFGQANYSAAKLGIVGLANSLAIEGRNKGVLVNTIAPIAGSRLTETVLPPELIAALKPDFVSPLVGWLCHESCKDTGSIYEVGAGYHAKLRWERTRGQHFRARPFTVEELASKWDKVNDFTDAEHPGGANAIAPILEGVQKPSRGGNQFIDVDEALAAEMPTLKSRYSEHEVSLYALGVGAAADPLDASDLSLVFELNSQGFHVLPTFGVMPAFNAAMKMAQEGVSFPGLNYGFDRVLHGEQYTEVKRPLPAKAELTHKIKVKDIFDKGKNAIVVQSTTTYDEQGEELVYNEMSTVVRGAGGWGGDRGPGNDAMALPDRKPDAVVEEKTSANAALLYRLSGDWNPLHADPAFAKAFGFDKPILHGLCFYGYAGRHVIKAFCGGDPRRFKSIRVRFAESVFPGETLVTEMWKESDTRILFRTQVKERDKVVLSNAVVELYTDIPQAKPKAAARSAAAGAAAAEPVSADYFNALAVHLATKPEVIGKIGAVFQWKLSEPASEWVVDLKNGKGEVRPGSVDKPDVTMEMSEADYLAMATGKADPQKLYFGGKLKIGGNAMLSQKLAHLGQPEAQLINDAMNKRLAAGAGAAAAAPANEPVSADYFNALAAHLAAKPEVIGKIGAVFQWKLSDPASEWVVDLKNGKGDIRPGSVEKADVTMEMSEADYLAMATGKADPQKLYFGGKLKIGGNAMLSQKLAHLGQTEPKLVTDAMQKRLASGGSAAPVATASAKTAAQAPAIFVALEERLKKDSGLAKTMAAKLQFQVKNPDAGWVLDLSQSPAQVLAGAADDVVTTFTLDDAALTELSRGSTSARELFQRGRLKVDGDMRNTQALGLFEKLI